MKREEAIIRFERQLKAAQVVLDSGFGSNPGESDRLYRERKEMAEIAIAALRGPTREQVGMGMWIRELTPQKLSGRTISHCSKCWHCVFWPNEHTNFCPDCGMPMTDEAVDIMMKRLEEMRNG